MWNCPSCGNENSGNASFCTECGQRRPDPTAQARPQQTPPAPPTYSPPQAPPAAAYPPVQSTPVSGAYPPPAGRVPGGYTPPAGAAYPPPAAYPGGASGKGPAAPKAKKPKKKSRWWLWLLAALAVLAAAAVICYFTVHVWSPATCTSPETCSICGETRGSALGHDGSEATCEKPSICSRCHKVLEPPLGHDAAPATCTEASVCTRCGETVEPALGHDWLAATYDRPETCSRCGEIRGEVKGWVGDLYGSMGEETLVLYGNGESHPYLLSKPVNKAYRMTLYLKLTSVDGDPYGTWGLYGRDLQGKWNLLSTFDVDSSAYNNYVGFPMQMDGIYTVDALSMVPMTDADYSLKYSFYYEDVQEYVD